eukprot:COSAG01_NODE_35_length_34814_cov_128.883624_4_plen_312_part_00
MVARQLTRAWLVPGCGYPTGRRVTIVLQEDAERTETPNCGDDSIIAVNLTRTVQPGDLDAPHGIRGAVEALAEALPEAAASVELSHHVGGPCEGEAIMTCLVVGGASRGWLLERDLSEAVRTAHARASQRTPAGPAGGGPDSGGESGATAGALEEVSGEGEGEGSTGSAASSSTVGGGQTVSLRGLRSASHLNGQLGLAIRHSSEKGRWLVRLASDELKWVKPVNLSPGEGKFGRVMVFWGDARWSRTQLLGEIARGTLFTPTPRRGRAGRGCGLLRPTLGASGRAVLAECALSVWGQGTGAWPRHLQLMC